MDSSDSEEETIRYGTPLEPYEEDEVPSKKKYQQPPDQYALDAHGRRRFHGAFTGGFSAGFGNTVGTQEGWSPATFKSSRKEKAQISYQKPEDFMDEDDRGEFGIAPKFVQTSSEFSGQKRPRQQRFHDGPIPGEPVLDQMLRAVHETAAVRMLRKMGWRDGRGTGVKVSAAERRRVRDQHKVYGCYMPPEMRQNTEVADESESSGSEFEYETLFEPEDYEPYVLHPKNDTFGLGYSGLSRHSVLGNLVGEYGQDAGSSKSHLMMKDKGKKVSIRGQAFGVGALETEDDDIYAMEDMSHYDFSIGGAAAVEAKRKTVQREKNVLQGFVKSSKPLPTVPSYPPPALPRDYTPAPAGARRTRFEPTTHVPRDQGLGRHELTAEARGELLGETPLTKPTEPNAQKDKLDLLTKITGRNVNFVTIIDKTKPEEENKKELDYISIKDSGKEFRPVFKPFVSDYKKQARYETYLQDKDRYMTERDSAVDKLSEWEKEREIIEFEQAAKLYKPLTGIMGDRFTHASEPDAGAINPLCAVAKSSNNYGLATPEQIDAANKGLYGTMTRTELAWRPEALVCKRFNVPEPGGARPEPQKQDKPKLSYSIFSYMESSVHDKTSFTKEQTKFSGSVSLSKENVQSSTNKTKQIEKTNKMDGIENVGFSKRLTVTELFLKESEKAVEKEKEVTETIENFDKMDLYKSIFLSDSENEEDNNKDKEATDFIDVPRNVERNTSPPRGIFANINFDELNSWKRTPEDKNVAKNTEIPTEINNKKDISAVDNTTEVGNDDMYGPKIPDNLIKRLESVSSVKNTDNFKPTFRSKGERDKHIEINSSSSESWVDVKEVSSKKAKKKSKKHKTKHKKSKHKKKSK